MSYIIEFVFCKGDSAKENFKDKDTFWPRDLIVKYLFEFMEHDASAV